MRLYVILAVSTIDSVSPTTGSVWGGLRITLRGQDFVNPSKYPNEKAGDIIIVSFVKPGTGEALTCEIHPDGCNKKMITCYTPGLEPNIWYDINVNLKVGENAGLAEKSSPIRFMALTSKTPVIEYIEDQSQPAGQLEIKTYGPQYTGCKTTNMSCPNLLTRTKFELTADPYGTMWIQPSGGFIGCVRVCYYINTLGKGETALDKRRVNPFNKICDVTSYPVINAISPTQGSNNGNVTIEINVPYIEDGGSQSTYTKLKITVGGKPCEITHVEKNEYVMCLVPAKVENDDYSEDMHITHSVFM
ncbi:Fibrocystin-L [Mactra antiquata]